MYCPAFMSPDMNMCFFLNDFISQCQWITLSIENKNNPYEQQKIQLCCEHQMQCPNFVQQQWCSFVTKTYWLSLAIKDNVCLLEQQ